MQSPYQTHVGRRALRSLKAAARLCDDTVYWFPDRLLGGSRVKRFGPFAWYPDDSQSRIN